MPKIEKKNIFDYELPQEKIAQRPVHPQDSAKLLLCDKKNNEVKESVFSSLCDFVSKGDLIIFNNTKVIPARFLGHLETGGKVEILLIKKIDKNKWEAIGKPLKKLKQKNTVIINEKLKIVVDSFLNDERIVVSFLGLSDKLTQKEIFENGIMPIPPYIRKGISDSKDKIDYQTNFAKVLGSIAAPTASLHFTKNLIANLESKGINKEFITLHVGTPSFLPLWKNDDKDGESMRLEALPGEEFLVYSEKIKEKIKETRKNGNKVIAVGTTCVRALESMAKREDLKEGDIFSTSLLISPGFKFKLVDAMITNFHQPATSHILMMQAFMGKRLLKKSYDYALNNDFRFLSYGDGMFVF